MGATSIQWTDFSTNPIRARLRDAAHVGLTTGGYGSGIGHYCEKISPGCAFCYASGSQPRFGMPEFPGAKKGEPGVELFFDDSRLREVLARRVPTRYFWCDMTDMFGRWVPFEWIDKCFATMALTPQHTHQILTKRPERMAEYLNETWQEGIVEGHKVGPVNREEVVKDAAIDMLIGAIGEQDRFWTPDGMAVSTVASWPLPNVWLGTSVEDQERAYERLPHLLRCPATIRFLSCEPLLGPIDLFGTWGKVEGTTVVAAHGVDWIIVGGESGPGARPMDVAWARSIVAQCKAAGLAVFCKQLGANVIHNRCTGPGEHWPSGTRYEEVYENDRPTWRILLKDKKGGDPSEWPEDLQIRQFPDRQPVPELRTRCSVSFSHPPHDFCDGNPSAGLPFENLRLQRKE